MLVAEMSQEESFRAAHGPNSWKHRKPGFCAVRIAPSAQRKALIMASETGVLPTGLTCRRGVELTLHSNAV
jgi:hypothetical protein